MRAQIGKLSALIHKGYFSMHGVVLHGCAEGTQW